MSHKLNIGIIGGGVNGLACAWHLSKQRHQVDVFDKNMLMSETSSASTKLLHGGLRYLKSGKIGLVREALREREDWLKRNERLTKRVKIIIPTYKTSTHSRWLIFCGLFFYRQLVRSASVPKSRYLSKQELLSLGDGLSTDRLLCGHEFYDAQMDDYALGMWMKEEAASYGANFYEHCAIKKIETSGVIYLSDGSTRRYDRIINASGPWAKQLLDDSGIDSPYSLTLVRGSHLLLETGVKHGYMLESPIDRRLFFVLPYKNKTLVGTTEVSHNDLGKIECSPSERRYLIESFEHYFPNKHFRSLTTFSGVRPLLRHSGNLSAASREYRLEKKDRLITVWGGKWTTCRSLAAKVATLI